MHPQARDLVNTDGGAAMTLPSLTPILAVNGLSKVIRGVSIVDDVSFEIPEGGSLAVVGESGSGKTTVARMITGLTKASSGSIALAGTERSSPTRSVGERRARAREVQLVFQDPYSSLDPRYTAAQTIHEALRMHGQERDRVRLSRRVGEIADMVGLSDKQLDSRPGSLSGGQRQRIAIARALAAEARLVILDEPVAALDVSIQAQVLNLLDDIRRAVGTSYLFISHDLAVVRQVTEDIVVMRNGRIVERGRTAEVLDNPVDDYTKLLRESVPQPGWRAKRSFSI